MEEEEEEEGGCHHVCRACAGDIRALGEHGIGACLMLQSDLIRSDEILSASIS